MPESLAPRFLARAAAAISAAVLAGWILRDAITSVEAANEAWFLSLLGVPASVTGPGVVTLIGENASFVITLECSGIFSAGLLAALILSTVGVPASRKLLGTATGVAAIYLANLVRIAAAVAAYGVGGEGLMDLIHRVVGGGILVALALTAWALWLSSEIRRARSGLAAATNNK